MHGWIDGDILLPDRRKASTSFGFGYTGFSTTCHLLISTGTEEPAAFVSSRSKMSPYVPWVLTTGGIGVSHSRTAMRRGRDMVIVFDVDLIEE